MELKTDHQVTGSAILTGSGQGSELSTPLLLRYTTFLYPIHKDLGLIRDVDDQEITFIEYNLKSTFRNR